MKKFYRTWKTIDCAPVGEDVILFSPDGSPEILVGHRFGDGPDEDWYPQHEAYLKGRPFDIGFTHWMELPEHPSEPSSLDAEKLRAELDYDPETGNFTRKKTSGSRLAGTAAGGLAKNGYLYIGAAGNRYLGHRLAWLYMTGAWPVGEIDHANMNPSDNRWQNLRSATKAQNRANVGARRNNPLGVKGVRFHPHQKQRPYAANISIDGRPKYLGSFETAQEAHEAYCTAAQERHGEFARGSR